MKPQFLFLWYNRLKLYPMPKTDDGQDILCPFGCWGNGYILNQEGHKRLKLYEECIEAFAVIFLLAISIFYRQSLFTAFDYFAVFLIDTVFQFLIFRSLPRVERANINHISSKEKSKQISLILNIFLFLYPIFILISAIIVLSVSGTSHIYDVKEWGFIALELCMYLFVIYVFGKNLFLRFLTK